MRRSTGQATLEFLLLVGLLAVLTLVLGVALASGAAASTADALRRALRPPSPAHDDTWAIGSTTWGPLIRRYAPRVVLERDLYGEDASVPVDFAHCRRRACARLGVARAVVFVHLVRRPTAAYIHYWFYYPDSRATHLPAGGLGTHRDDWEGVIVRLAADGAAARATAHGGLAGAGPWWATAPGWRPIGRRPLVYRASGSHANGFGPGDIDLAGDRWNGTLGAVDPTFVAADLARSRRFRFDPAASPPWMKRLWRDPDAAGTGTDGSQGRETAAARAWAATWEGLHGITR
jgi:hypothetical protein